MGVMVRWQEEGIVVDLERLEHQAEDLDLHHFADAVRSTRGRLGRYLVLHTEEIDGDEAAPPSPRLPTAACCIGDACSGPGS